MRFCLWDIRRAYTREYPIPILSHQRRWQLPNLTNRPGNSVRPSTGNNVARYTAAEFQRLTEVSLPTNVDGVPIQLEVDWIHLKNNLAHGLKAGNQRSFLLQTPAGHSIPGNLLVCRMSLNPDEDGWRVAMVFGTPAAKHLSANPT